MATRTPPVLLPVQPKSSDILISKVLVFWLVGQRAYVLLLILKRQAATFAVSLLDALSPRPLVPSFSRPLVFTPKPDAY